MSMVYVCMYIHIDIYIYICVYIYVERYIYISIHIHTLSVAPSRPPKCPMFKSICLLFHGGFSGNLSLAKQGVWGRRHWDSQTLKPFGHRRLHPAAPAEGLPSCHSHIVHLVRWALGLQRLQGLGEDFGGQCGPCLQLMFKALAKTWKRCRKKPKPQSHSTKGSYRRSSPRSPGAEGLPP